MKLSLLVGRGVVHQLAALARTSRRRIAAVAYVGDGASQLLRFKPGDTLVTDMSEESVRRGNTNPFEIERLYKRQVRLFTRRGLHAKILVLDRGVVIGSANLSRRSLDNDEASVWIRDPAFRVALLTRIAGWAKRQITPQYIKHCQAIYIPPRSTQSKRPEHPVWIDTCGEYDPPPWLRKQIEGAEESARRRLASPRRFEIHTALGYDLADPLCRSGKPGDMMVHIWRRASGRIEVWPPGTISSIVRIRSSEGKDPPMYMYQVEFPRRARLLKWSVFRAAVRGLAGIELGRQSAYGAVRSHRGIDGILSLWPKGFERSRSR